MKALQDIVVKIKNIEQVSRDFFMKSASELAPQYLDMLNELLGISSSSGNQILYQWELDPKHTKEDICDSNAITDVGFGPGIYSLDMLPEYPAHPKCKCHLKSLTSSYREGDSNIWRVVITRDGFGFINNESEADTLVYGKAMQVKNGKVVSEAKGATPKVTKIIGIFTTAVDLSLQEKINNYINGIN